MLMLNIHRIAFYNLIYEQSVSILLEFSTQNYSELQNYKEKMPCSYTFFRHPIY